MYTRLIDGNYLNVNISSVDLGSLDLKPRDMLVVCIGTRKNPYVYRREFLVSERHSLNQTFTFKVNHLDTASFVVMLMRRQYFAGDKEIGEINLKVDAFEMDAVVTHTFELDTPQFYPVRPKIKLGVHLNSTTTQPFLAAQGVLKDDYKINVDKCICA